MEKNNQPVIITAIVGGIILIIALALIFTRNGEATTPEITNPGNTGEIENEEEQEETGQQPADPQTPQQPQQPVDPQTPQEPEQPTSDTLPDNWDQLTSQQKTDLNPFDCDIETQYIRADNGQCQDKATPVNVYKLGEPFVITIDDELQLEVVSNVNCHSAKIELDDLRDRFSGPFSWLNADELRAELQSAEDDFITKILSSAYRVRAEQSYPYFNDRSGIRPNIENEVLTRYDIKICRMSNTYKNVGDDYNVRKHISDEKGFLYEVFRPCHVSEGYRLSVSDPFIIDDNDIQYQSFSIIREPMDPDDIFFARTVALSCIPENPFPPTPYVLKSGEFVQSPRNHTQKVFALPADATIESLPITVGLEDKNPIILNIRP